MTQLVVALALVPPLLPAVRSARVAALDRELSATLTALNARRETARTPADEERVGAAVRAEWAVATTRIAERALAIARPVPGDDAAFAALKLVAEACDGTQPANAEAVVLLAARHLHHPRAGEVVRAVAVRGGTPAHAALLRAIADTHPDRPTRVLAACGYAEATWTYACGLTVPEAAVPAHRDEARRAFEWLARDFPADPLANWVAHRPVGEYARDRLAQIAAWPVGRPAPATTGTDVVGRPFDLKTYRGKVVLLTFWASWCGPCLALVPHERELAARYAGRPFAVVGVNGDKDTGPLAKLCADRGITWPSLWNGPGGADGPAADAWGVTGWPTLALIDTSGVVRRVQVGRPRDPADLDRAVEGLVREAEAAGRR